MLDKTDKEILRRLQNDGRLSNAKLSSELALSETPCWRRVKRLEESGYISEYQANLNRKKLSLGVMAFVQVSCTDHDEESTRKFEAIIKDSENVMACHNTTGDADFLLQVIAKDLDGYSTFVEKTLRKLPGVIGIKSSISLREVKSSSKLPIF